jgi:hypothetical protein
MINRDQWRRKHSAYLENITIELAHQMTLRQQLPEELSGADAQRYDEITTEIEALEAMRVETKADTFEDYLAMVADQRADEQRDAELLDGSSHG